MKTFKLRAWDKRFNDPFFLGDPVAQDMQRIARADMDASDAVDQRDGDGRRTVIIHGKRVTVRSPKVRWPHAELWGVTRCNVVYWRESLTDWDRWFDIHPVETTPYHRGIKAKRREAWDWYCRQDTSRPIYLTEPHPDVPASVAFPRQMVQDTLKTTRFTVSVDWLIGLAICEGFERIVLNGIGTRMEPDFQFAHQGILYWLGYAEGRGLDLVIEGPSCYAVPEKVYGYEAGAPVWEEPAVKAPYIGAIRSA